MRLPGLTCLHSWLRRLQSSCGHLALELGNCLCFRWGCQHCCTCPTALKHQATAAYSNTVSLSGAVALRLRHNAADAAACWGSQLAQLLLDGIHQQHTVVSMLRPRSHVPSEHWSCPHIFTAPSKHCLLNSSTLRKSDRLSLLPAAQEHPLRRWRQSFSVRLSGAARPLQRRMALPRLPLMRWSSSAAAHSREGHAGAKPGPLNASPSTRLTSESPLFGCP